MYTERTSTENGSPANAIEQNADTPTVLQTSIDEITTDLNHIQSRVDAGETTLASS